MFVCIETHIFYWSKKLQNEGATLKVEASKYVWSKSVFQIFFVIFRFCKFEFRYSWFSQTPEKNLAKTWSFVYDLLLNSISDKNIWLTRYLKLNF